MTYEATRRVESSARTFAIIEHFDQVGRARISQIARELDMSKGIVHNHVSTLRELGYVTKIGDHYQLSPKFLQLGHRVRTRSTLNRASSDLLDAYAERVETGVVCMQRAGEQGVVTDGYRLPASLGLTVGTALPLSRSLPGVLLQLAVDASSADDESHEYDRDRLAQQLAEQGFVDGPLVPTSTADCVAFPVTDADGNCHGSIGVLQPEGQSTDDGRRLAASVPTLREQIEARLQQSGTDERSVATEKHTWIDG